MSRPKRSPHEAAQDGAVGELIQLAIDKGAINICVDPDSPDCIWLECGDKILHQRDARGRTPAHVAARYNRIACLWLLAARAPMSLFERDAQGLSPAQVAGDEACKMFLEHCVRQIGFWAHICVECARDPKEIDFAASSSAFLPAIRRIAARSNVDEAVATVIDNWISVHVYTGPCSEEALTDLEVLCRSLIKPGRVMITRQPLNLQMSDEEPAAEPTKKFNTSTAPQILRKVQRRVDDAPQNDILGSLHVSVSAGGTKMDMADNPFGKATPGVKQGEFFVSVHLEGHLPEEPTHLPLGLVLCVDLSMSMSPFVGPEGALNEAIRKIVEGLQVDKDCLGIVGFASKSDVMLAPQLPMQDKAPALRTIDEMLDVYPSTNIQAGLEGALDAIIKNMNFPDELPFVMIALMTDGCAVAGIREAQQLCDHLEERLNKIKGRKQAFKIMVHGFANHDHDPKYLHAVAERFGGEYSFLKDGIDLTTAFREHVTKRAAAGVKINIGINRDDVELLKVFAPRSFQVEHTAKNCEITVPDLKNAEVRDIVFKIKLKDPLTADALKMHISCITVDKKGAVAPEMEVNIAGDFKAQSNPEHMKRVADAIVRDIITKGLLDAAMALEGNRKGDAAAIVAASTAEAEQVIQNTDLPPEEAEKLRQTVQDAFAAVHIWDGPSTSPSTSPTSHPPEGAFAAMHGGELGQSAKQLIQSQMKTTVADIVSLANKASAGQRMPTEEEREDELHKKLNELKAKRRARGARGESIEDHHNFSNSPKMDSELAAMLAKWRTRAERIAIGGRRSSQVMAERGGGTPDDKSRQLLDRDKVENRRAAVSNSTNMLLRSQSYTPASLAHANTINTAQHSGGHDHPISPTTSANPGVPVGGGAGSYGNLLNLVANTGGDSIPPLRKTPPLRRAHTINVSSRAAPEGAAAVAGKTQDDDLPKLLEKWRQRADVNLRKASLEDKSGEGGEDFSSTQTAPAFGEGG
eukprot:CAMPEP_0206233024 /NCGR_PEP_ID=MMETSP0047_2-20121206/11747_1 /ASSEMBLY_ACC=CAM_ASM_000192 /TAXON_ID=195065 /ORGANISM="Chroomonas mesostigmatica_cf, Strain CCMP1168" /LENGTH=976 /DNA_ID=CAMNT_0053656837 /DNA_START=49 /DNA_END=2976 /DNA_ORIENTATION=-